MPPRPIGLMSTVVQQPTIQKIVFFVPNLCPNSGEANNHHLCQQPLEDTTHQVTYPRDLPWNSQAAKGHGGLAMLSTTPTAVVFPVPSYTCVKSVAPAIVPASVPTKTVWLSKPTPWTPLQPFILERELSNHPDKAFVMRLINDLCHGCFIGYEGPQFSYCTNNLVSAYQYPTIIDATLEKECQLGCILGSFQHPSLPNQS